MAIRKRGDAWQIDYLDPDGKRKRQSFKTRKEATLELAARISAMDSGTYREKSLKCTTTLSQMIEGPYKEKFESQSSYQGKAGYLKQFNKWIQERKGIDPLLSGVTFADLDAYRNYLDKTPTFKGTLHTKRGINLKFIAIHQMFAYGVKLQLLRKNPFNGETLQYSEQKNKRTRFLSKKEIKKLLGECEYNRDFFRRVVWTLNTGMDYEDIQRFTWGDITKDHQLWTYRSKLVRDGVRKDFQIPLNNELAALLKEIRSEAGISKKDAPVFKRRDINGSFRAAVKRAGLYSPDASQNVTFKTLRHTFASHLVKQGRHPKEVADLMGHNSIEMTMRYMHLSPSQLADAVHSLDGLTGLSQNGTKSEKNVGEARHY